MIGADRDVEGEQRLHGERGGIGIGAGVTRAIPRAVVGEAEASGGALLRGEELDRLGGNAFGGHGQSQHGERLRESVRGVPRRIGHLVREPAAVLTRGDHQSTERQLEIGPVDRSRPPDRSEGEQRLGRRTGDSDAGDLRVPGGVGRDRLAGGDRVGRRDDHRS